MKTKDNKGKGVKMMIRGMKYALLIALLLVSTKPAYAELNAVGPIDPNNGFPLWYQDSNGLAIELGLVEGLNIFDPPIPGNTFSEQIGFGAEGFYWIAESSMDIGGVVNGAFIRLALEYAFANEDPIDGDQFVFGRIRIRIDTPVAGTYVVTHPYGVDVFPDVPAGVRAVNATIDVGSVTPDFQVALTSRIGPFLTAVSPPAPPGFVGAGVPADPLADPILHTVTGSPFGTNFFRIDGPLGSNLDGNGQDFIETDLFMLSGKIFTGVVPTPLRVQRATYQRTASGNVDVFATSTPDATVSFSGTGLPLTFMAGDGTGGFFGRVNLADASSLPPFVTVTADNPSNSITDNNRDLVDVVTITRAEYDATAQMLTIMANSSDVLVPPTLTTTGLGTLVNGSLVLNNVLAPPAEVTVTSSAGGSGIHNVNVVNPPSEVLTATRVFFRTVGNAWLVSGTDSVTTTGNIITIRLGGLGGPVIGTVQSTLTGVWNIISQNSDIIPNQGDTITLESSAGALLTGIPITIIRR